MDPDLLPRSESVDGGGGHDCQVATASARSDGRAAGELPDMMSAFGRAAKADVVKAVA